MLARRRDRDRGRQPAVHRHGQHELHRRRSRAASTARRGLTMPSSAGDAAGASERAQIDITSGTRAPTRRWARTCRRPACPPRRRRPPTRRPARPRGRRVVDGRGDAGVGSSASASTVAVSGATVSDRPTANTTAPAAGRVTYEDLLAEPQQQDAGRRRPAARAHEQARPVAVGERAEAPRQREHHERHRHRRQAALERGVAGHLLQVDDEEEEQDREPAYIASVSRLPTAKLRRENSSSFSIGSASRALVDQERGEGDRAADERHRDRRAAPAVARLLDQREHDAAEPERAEAGAERRRPAGRAIGVVGGTATRTSSSVASTTGTFSAKIQRHETLIDDRTARRAGRRSPRCRPRPSTSRSRRRARRARTPRR